ncbi:hypothetical protein M4D49_27215 [Cupriavidus pauculus]|uniref:hypothetical protein n=1 Tax=Burkholderiaceae TaxID=119060 RepID=UPI002041556A|nr:MULTISPECIES: hypothetical protein [Burkholderiaceae]MCM3609179.1 hypothetical protein [Cupriavidus pauculus]
MKKCIGTATRNERVSELRQEETSLHDAIADIDSKSVRGGNAMSLALRDARTRELAAVQARLVAFGEVPVAGPAVK